MIRIRYGKYKFLNEIADELFVRLNQKNKDDVTYHKKNSIYGKLDTLISKHPRSKYKVLWEYFRNNLEILIKAEPVKLYSVHLEINNIITTNNLRFSEVKKKCLNLFNYKYFRSRSPHAVYLSEQLNIQVCPYCNRQFTSTLKKEEIVFHDFDHYFPQKYYPYFVLSFYNLIPSCNNCNSKIKHSLKFSLKYHIHPYLDSFNDILKFTTNILKTDFFFKKGQDFIIEFKENYRKNPKPENINRARRTAKDFMLKEIYSLHKDYVIELVQKYLVYTDEYIDYLYKEYNDIFTDKSDLYKMILGVYVKDTEIGKRPMSKFVKDIAEEFGILK